MFPLTGIVSAAGDVCSLRAQTLITPQSFSSSLRNIDIFLCLYIHVVQYIHVPCSMYTAVERPVGITRRLTVIHGKAIEFLYAIIYVYIIGYVLVSMNQVS